MRLGPIALALTMAAHVAGFAAAPKPAAPSAPAAQAAPAAKLAATKALSGTVSTLDGKPAAGAVVRAIPMPPPPKPSIRGIRGPDVPKAMVGRTDAKGAFRLELSDAGPFAVRAMSAGYAPASANDVPAGAVLSLKLKPGVTVVGRVLDLTTQKPVAGATVTGLEKDASRFGRDAAHTVATGDDGTFRLADCAPGVLAVDAIAPGKARAQLDRVVAKAPAPGEERKPEENTLFLQPGGKIAGRVTGPDGKPLADAIVTASGSKGNLFAMIRGGRNAQRTGADGKFLFDGFVAGNKYTLRATKDGLGAHEEGPIPIEAGTERTDLELKLDNASSVTFRLVTAKDLPIKDVDLRLAPPSSGPGGGPGGRRRGPGIGFGANDVDRDKIVPQGDGKFLVKSLDPGTYDVTLEPADYADVVREGVRLKAGETTDLGTLRVKDSKSVAGKVTDATGQPVEGATIFGMFMEADIRLSREARSGPDGRYRISGLGDSPLRDLSVRAAGYASASREGAIPGDDDVDFTLEKTGSIVGKVLLRGAVAPAAFRIQASPEAKESQQRPGIRVMISNRPDEDLVFTDPEGNFRLDDVDPGIVTVTATADGKAPTRKTGLKIVSEQVTDVGTITLDDGRTLRGRVVSSHDDAPIAGATVSVSLPQGTMIQGGVDNSAGTAISALDGHFTIAGLEPRTYTIDTSQPDYSPNSGRVEILADADTDDFVVKLSRGGTITGLVRDAQKVPVPNVGVLLTKIPMGGGSQTVTTGADGRYMFEKITPGEYTVMKAPTGGIVMMFGGMKSVVVREGETTTFDIDDAAKINLTGRVLKGGQAVPNSVMVLMPGTGGGPPTDLKQTRTDADGRYQVGLDTPGTYTVAVAGATGVLSRRSAVTIEVPDKPDAVVDVTLRPSGIAGKVVNQDGKPVSGAMVSVSSNDAPAAADGHRTGGLQGITEPDGSYLVDGIPAGTYTLSVSAAGYKTAEVPSVTLANDSDVQSVDVRLDPGRTVRGHVFDVAGNTIPNALILTAASGSASVGGDAVRATSDVNGAFVITAPAEGPIDLTAIADGYPPARAVSLQPEDGVEVALKAPRPSRVRVMVIDAGGRPVPSASVSYRAVPDFLGAGFLNFASRGTLTGADGIATLTAMGPGGYELTVSAGPKKATQAVSVAEGGEAAATVTLN